MIEPQLTMQELVDAHKEARERWLSLQAGPLYRERHAAYVKMSELATLIRGLS